MELDTLHFEPEELRQAVHESGLADEFDVSEPASLALCATACALVTAGYAAESDQVFRDSLKGLQLPASEQEQAFLFGMAQYIRSTVLESLEGAAEQETFRQVTGARMELARNSWPMPA